MVPTSIILDYQYDNMVAVLDMSQDRSSMT